MILCIDIGGTNTRIGVSEDKKHILKKVSFETCKNLDDEMNAIAQHVQNLVEDKMFTSIVVGVPGVVDSDGVLVSSPNLSLWEKENISKHFHNLFNTKAHIVNDAELATLGEAVFGAGVGHNVVAYITVSTGIGGGRVVHRQFDKAFSGFEPGRQIIDIATQKTLQDLVSGAAVHKEKGVAPKDITDEFFWKEKAKILADGLWNTIVYWSPEILVLGGPMVLKKPGISVDDVITEIKKIDKGTVPMPKIVLSNLGDDIGLYGGLAYNA